MISDALVSDDGRYRYWLTRVWDPEAPRLSFVMLNPSTADASVDDPTIRRCIGFARRDGFGSIVVTNLYAFRATSPAMMARAVDPAGPDNDQHLRFMAASARLHDEPIIAAWGAHVDRWRVRYFMGIADRADVRCLGTTKDRSPRHPLYVRGDQPFEVWP